MINHNKSLAEAAQSAGIDDPKGYAIFQNKGVSRTLWWTWSKRDSSKKRLTQLIIWLAKK